MLDRVPPEPHGSQLARRGDGVPMPHAPIGYYPHGYGFDEPEREGLFDPLKLLFLLVQYRWFIAISLACALVGGFIITMMQTPIYQSAARLEVVVPSARVFEDMQVVSEMPDVRQFQTAREKILSRSLAQRVVYQLGLADKPDFLYPAPSFSPMNIFARAFGLSSSRSNTEHTAEDREDIAISRVLGNMSVSLVPNTSLLNISYRNQSPQYARDIANQIAQSFIDQRVDQTGETSDLARQFIQEQVLQVKEKLQQSEEELLAYARQAGISLAGSEKSLIASNIESMNAALSKAMEERLNLDLLVAQIDQGRGESLQEVLASEPLQKFRGEIVQAKAEYQQKLATFKPEFPEMKQLSQRIAELESQFRNGVVVILDGIRMRRDESVKREQELRTKLAELEDTQNLYEDKSIQYTILKREVDSNRAQYDTLISKLNEVGVGAELRTQNASIVDYAVLARSPATPRLPINLAIALVLCSALCAAVIYLLELLNNTFVNPDQIEKELDLPVLGILPKLEEAELEAALADQQSSLSEAYRSLRTSIQFSGTEGMPKTLVVTSSEPAEAKSTTACKLARDFAALGKSVIIIDADMRKPSVHRKFGLDNTLGLSNLLTNTVSRENLPRVIKRTNDNGVCVMTSGTVPPNPADLLSSTKMALLVEHMASRFDLVVLDSPPVLGLSDSPILSRIAQGTLLMVSSNKVSHKSAKTALKRLRSAGANVIGAALSQFTVGKFDYNYAYKYMNYQYYKYGQEEVPQLEGQGGQNAIAKKQDTFLDRLGRGARSSLGRLAQRLKPVD